MSKPIHVSENLHKAIKVVSSRRERPMKEITMDIIRGQADDEVINEILSEERRLADGSEGTGEKVEA